MRALLAELHAALGAPGGGRPELAGQLEPLERIGDRLAAPGASSATCASRTAGAAPRTRRYSPRW
jgi:hypothetical protein